jgi:Skp family chaperone for outer membrane proteins
MNRNRLLLILPLLALLPVVPALAQRPAAPPPQTVQPRPAADPPISKVAVIYSAAFQDPKAGIARFASLVNKLNSEFQKVQDDLNLTSQKLKQLQAEISDAQQGKPATTPAQLQTKIDAFDQLKKEYQRGGEDAQAKYARRRQEIFLPLQEDIGKALDVFAKAHNITLILDGTQLELVYAADSIDITRAFISDYNLKNPVTAAVTPPR